MGNPRNVAGASEKRDSSPNSLTPNPASSQQKQPTRQVRWQTANPKARWAHVALASGLRRGLLERQPCAVCGHDTVDGHHENYDEPLNVIWLCRRHHLALHRKVRSNG